MLMCDGFSDYFEQWTVVRACRGLVGLGVGGAPVVNGQCNKLRTARKDHHPRGNTEGDCIALYTV